MQIDIPITLKAVFLCSDCMIVHEYERRSMQVLVSLVIDY